MCLNIGFYMSLNSFSNVSALNKNDSKSEPVNSGEVRSSTHLPLRIYPGSLKTIPNK